MCVWEFSSVLKIYTTQQCWQTRSLKQRKADKKHCKEVKFKNECCRVDYNEGKRSRMHVKMVHVFIMTPYWLGEPSLVVVCMEICYNWWLEAFMMGEINLFAIPQLQLGPYKVHWGIICTLALHINAAEGTAQVWVSVLPDNHKMAGTAAPMACLAVMPSDTFYIFRYTWIQIKFGSRFWLLFQT